MHWIYNYKRGAFYPFVPAGGGQQRDTERELRLKAQIGAELPIEPELERWFPLWGIPSELPGFSETRAFRTSVHRASRHRQPGRYHRRPPPPRPSTSAAVPR